jgi:hypothetical protein
MVAFKYTCILALILLGQHAHAAEYSLYDNTWPSGMYLSWNSSSGASGTIHYHPGTAGYSVPDDGSGGMTRRAVLAPEHSDQCIPFPGNATTNFRGQQAGIPFDHDVIVVVLVMFNRPCQMGDVLSEFGPDGKMNADVAGIVWMFSDLVSEGCDDNFLTSPPEPNASSHRLIVSSTYF